MHVVESGGPAKPGEDRPTTTWLILERLNDISAQVTDVRAQVMDVRAQVTDLRGEVADLRSSTDRRFEAVDRRFDALDRRWTWSLGLMAVMMLGLLAKVLLPGA